jgi:hypothetical protein
MEDKLAHQNIGNSGIRVIFWVCLIVFSLAVGAVFSQEKSEAPQNTADKFDPAVQAFRQRVKDYVAMREQLENTLPKLLPEATPEQIKEHQIAFEELVRKERSGAKPGDLFTSDIAAYIHKTLNEDFKGTRKQRLKKTINDEQPVVPLRINYPYPDDQETVTMPPTLLLKLPTLPKQMRYLFVGRNMILLDRETRLIIDYLLNVLPQ